MKHLCALIALTLTSLTIAATAPVSTPWLPNPTLTPGAIRTSSRDDVCGTKTSTVRHVTTAVKKEVMRRYGLDWSHHSEVEIDHLQSLEIGGSNDITNLWPEYWHLNANGRDLGAHTKDRVENAAHRAVCDGKLDLAEAQSQMAQDWTVLYVKLVGPLPEWKH